MPPLAPEAAEQRAAKAERDGSFYQEQILEVIASRDRVAGNEQRLQDQLASAQQQITNHGKELCSAREEIAQAARREEEFQSRAASLESQKALHVKTAAAEAQRKLALVEEEAQEAHRAAGEARCKAANAAAEQGSTEEQLEVLMGEAHLLRERVESYEGSRLVERLAAAAGGIHGSGVSAGALGGFRVWPRLLPALRAQPARGARGPAARRRRARRWRR